MGALTGLVVSVAAISGVIALTRALERKGLEARRKFDAQMRGRKASDGAVIDYERDPQSGVFVPKN